MNGDWDAYEAAMEPTTSFNWEPAGRKRAAMIECNDISDEELVLALRSAAAAWFNDNQLGLLEELIKRVLERGSERR
jgi:hypothetical protein